MAILSSLVIPRQGFRFFAMTWEVKVAFTLMVITSAIHSGAGAGLSYGYESDEETNSTNWPTKMTFHETKTNYMLGEAILRRIYARLEHTENLIQIQMNQVVDKLSYELHRNLKDCDRKRRRVDPNNVNPNNPSESYSLVARRDRQGKRDKDKKGKKKEKTPYEPYSRPTEGYQY